MIKIQITTDGQTWQDVLGMECDELPVFNCEVPKYVSMISWSCNLNILPTPRPPLVSRLSVESIINAVLTN